MFYFEVLRALHEKDIRYLIVGGLAVNLHGVPRATQDIDIILLMERDNIIRLCDCMRELGYDPTAPVQAEDLADPVKREEWIRDKNMKAFGFRHRDLKYRTVDVVIFHPLDFSAAYERRRERTAGGVPFSLVSMTDLIRLKTFAGRPQDLCDIELLRQAAELGDPEHDQP